MWGASNIYSIDARRIRYWSSSRMRERERMTEDEEKQKQTFTNNNTHITSHIIEWTEHSKK